MSKKFKQDNFVAVDHIKVEIEDDMEFSEYTLQDSNGVPENDPLVSNSAKRRRRTATRGETSKHDKSCELMEVPIKEEFFSGESDVDSIDNISPSEDTEDDESPKHGKQNSNRLEPKPEYDLNEYKFSTLEDAERKLQELGEYTKQTKNEYKSGDIIQYYKCKLAAGNTCPFKPIIKSTGVCKSFFILMPNNIDHDHSKPSRKVNDAVRNRIKKLYTSGYRAPEILKVINSEGGKKISKKQVIYCISKLNIENHQIPVNQVICRRTSRKHDDQGMSDNSVDLNSMDQSTDNISLNMSIKKEKFDADDFISNNLEIRVNEEATSKKVISRIILYPHKQKFSSFGEAESTLKGFGEFAKLNKNENKFGDIVQYYRCKWAVGLSCPYKPIIKSFNKDGNFQIFLPNDIHHDHSKPASFMSDDLKDRICILHSSGYKIPKIIEIISNESDVKYTEKQIRYFITKLKSSPMKASADESRVRSISLSNYSMRKGYHQHGGLFETFEDAEYELMNLGDYSKISRNESVTGKIVQYYRCKVGTGRSCPYKPIVLQTLVSGGFCILLPQQSMHDHSNRSRSFRKRGSRPFSDDDRPTVKVIYYKHAKPFEALIDAERELKNMGDFAKLSKNKNKSGDVIQYYRCKRAIRMTCPFKPIIKQQKNTQKFNILLPKDTDHDHSTPAKSFIATNIKEKIDTLHTSGLRVPDITKIINAEAEISKSQVIYRVKKKVHNDTSQKVQLRKFVKITACSNEEILKYTKVPGPDDSMRPYISNCTTSKTDVLNFFITSRKLVSHFQHIENIHCSGSYNIKIGDNYLIFLGATDLQRKFYLLGVALTLGDALNDYEFLFMSFQKAVKKLLPNTNFNQKILITDSTNQILAAFKRYFKHDNHRICFNHMTEQLEVAMENLQQETRLELLSDIGILHQARNKQEFQLAFGLFEQKYYQPKDPFVTEFIQYFKQTWYKTRVWYKGEARRQPSTNDSLWAIYDYLNKECMNLGAFDSPAIFEMVAELIQDESMVQNNGSEFTVEPIINDYGFYQATEWNKLNKSISVESKDDYCKIYVPGDSVSDLYAQSIVSAMQATHKSFQDFKSNLSDVYIISRPNDDYLRWTCTCEEYSIIFICKHIIGIAIRNGLVQMNVSNLS